MTPESQDPGMPFGSFLPHRQKPVSQEDAGLDLVRRLHRNIQAEPKWCVWEERGFTWWGHNLAQRIWADPPLEDSEGATFQRLHAQTDVFDGFDKSDRQIQFLNILNHTCTLSALVPASDGSRRVRLCCSMLLFPDNGDFVWHVFSTAAAMQAAEAVIISSSIDEEFRAGLLAADSQHPQSGPRLLADEMLDIIDAVIRPHGEGPSRYAGGAMGKLAKDLLRQPCLFASGSETGVTAEYPHPHHSYMLRLVTEDPHPRVGSGMLAMLNLPEGENDAETARTAMALNMYEIGSADTPAHFLGSWCAGVHGLAFISFFPNTLANDGMPVSVAGNLIGRACWHSGAFHAYDWHENFEPCMARYNERLKKIGLPGA